MADKNESTEQEGTGLSQSFVFDSKVKSDTFKTYEELSTEVGSKNAYIISCSYCKSKILKPLKASLVDKEVRSSVQCSDARVGQSTHAPAHQYECCVMFIRDTPTCGVSCLPRLSPILQYFVPDITAKGTKPDETEGKTIRYHWLVSEMMEFENIGFSKTVDGNVRFLACADCEIGPIGWHKVTDRHEFYITAEKVKYSES